MTVWVDLEPPDEPTSEQLAGIRKTVEQLKADPPAGGKKSRKKSGGNDLSAYDVNFKK